MSKKVKGTEDVEEYEIYEVEDEDNILLSSFTVDWKKKTIEVDMVGWVGIEAVKK